MLHEYRLMFAVLLAKDLAVYNSLMDFNMLWQHRLAASEASADSFSDLPPCPGLKSVENWICITPFWPLQAPASYDNKKCEWKRPNYNQTHFQQELNVDEPVVVALCPSGTKKVWTGSHVYNVWSPWNAMTKFEPHSKKNELIDPYAAAKQVLLHGKLSPSYSRPPTLVARVCIFGSHPEHAPAQGDQPEKRHQQWRRNPVHLIQYILTLVKKQFKDSIKGANTVAKN